MIAWTSYKKSINLVRFIQNQHAIFVGWDLAVFICRKNFDNIKILQMFKYDICDFVYVYQVIASLASLSELMALSRH